MTHVLYRNSKAGSVDAATHGMAKYVMELGLVEYRLAHVAPSVLAAASLALSLRLLDPNHRTLLELWTPTLEHYSSYSIQKLAPVVQALAEIVITNQVSI